MTKGQKPKDVFDIERIREIIELMEEHDLSEVDLQQGDEKIKLNRGGAAPVFGALPPLAAASAVTAGQGSDSSPDNSHNSWAICGINGFIKTIKVLIMSILIVSSPCI